MRFRGPLCSELFFDFLRESQNLSTMRRFSNLLRPVASSCVRPTTVLRRNLAIHEFASQDFMRLDGIAVPDAIVTRTPGEAEAAAKDLGAARSLLVFASLFSPPEPSLSSSLSLLVTAP
jgi:hypothetical protein